MAFEGAVWFYSILGGIVIGLICALFSMIRMRFRCLEKEASRRLDGIGNQLYRIESRAKRLVQAALMFHVSGYTKYPDRKESLSERPKEPARGKITKTFKIELNEPYPGWLTSDTVDNALHLVHGNRGFKVNEIEKEVDNDA